MGRLLVLLTAVTLVLLALPAFPARAGVTDLGTTLHVEWSPDTLTLRPKETGTVYFTIKNTANVSLYVTLFYLTVKSPGGSSGNITPDFFEIGPGRYQEVQVRIMSWASFGQEQGLSDAHMMILWGRNFTKDAGFVNYSSTADGETRILIPVVDDLSRTYFLFETAIAIIMVCALLVLVMTLRKRWSSLEPSRNPPKGPQTP
jgi:hypothetical protein